MLEYHGCMMSMQIISSLFIIGFESREKGLFSIRIVRMSESVVPIEINSVYSISSTPSMLVISDSEEEIQVVIDDDDEVEIEEDRIQQVLPKLVYELINPREEYDPGKKQEVVRPRRLRINSTLPIAEYFKLLKVRRKPDNQYKPETKKYSKAEMKKWKMSKKTHIFLQTARQQFFSQEHTLDNFLKTLKQAKTEIYLTKFEKLIKFNEKIDSEKAIISEQIAVFQQTKFNEREFKESIYEHLIKYWGQMFNEEYKGEWLQPKIRRMDNLDQIFYENKMFHKKGNMKRYFLIRRKYKFSSECNFMLESFKMNMLIKDKRKMSHYDFKKGFDAVLAFLIMLENPKFLSMVNMMTD